MSARLIHLTLLDGNTTARRASDIRHATTIGEGKGTCVRLEDGPELVVVETPSAIAEAVNAALDADRA